MRALVLSLMVCAALACNSTPSESSQRASSDAGVAVPSKLEGKVEIKLAPAEGDVQAQVREAILEASVNNRRIVVDVGASWCEPCERFREAAQNGELDSEFPGLTLLVFDLDRDRARLTKAGYQSQYIPLLVVPNLDGTPSDKRLQGGIKGAGAVREMVPRLHKLLD